MGNSNLDHLQTVRLPLQQKYSPLDTPLSDPVPADLDFAMAKELPWQTPSRLLPAVQGASFLERKEMDSESVHTGTPPVQAVTPAAQCTAARRARNRVTTIFAEATQVHPTGDQQVAKKAGIEARRTSATYANTAAASRIAFSSTPRPPTPASVQTGSGAHEREKRPNRRRRGSARQPTVQAKSRTNTCSPKAVGRIGLGLALATGVGSALVLYCRARAAPSLIQSSAPPDCGMVQERSNLKGFPGVKVVFHGPPPEGESSTLPFNPEMSESFAVLHAGEHGVSLSGQPPFEQITSLMQEAAKARREHLDKREAIKLLKELHGSILKKTEGHKSWFFGDYCTLKQLKNKNLPLSLSGAFRGVTSKPWNVWSTGEKRGLVRLDEIRDELRPYLNKNNRYMVELTLPQETEPEAMFDRAYKTVYKNAIQMVLMYNKVTTTERINRIRIPLLMHKGTARDKDHLARLAVAGVQLGLTGFASPDVTVEFEGDEANTFFKAALAVESQQLQTEKSRTPSGGGMERKIAGKW